MPATTHNISEVTPDGERFLVNSFQRTSVSILPFTVVVKLFGRPWVTKLARRNRDRQQVRTVSYSS